MKLYNSITKRVEPFEAMEGKKVRMYSCGPTVYSYQHIGNLRTYTFSDLLKRSLQFAGYRVLHAMNVTDVGHLTDDADAGEDKIERAAKAEGKDAWAMTEVFKAKFFEDCAGLNILPPDIVCRATDHIEEQIDMIKKMEEKGLIYKNDDGIYFDTTQFTPITDLSNMRIEASDEYSRVGTGDKRSGYDFSLWKFSPKDAQRQMEWDSPWGKGFPGWHLECSAMSMKYLGESFDIHTGGIDHIPVHHTNEIIQSEAVTGKPFANFWIHAGWLSFGESEKMSKSAGSTLLLDNILQEGFDPMAFRYLILTAHYRGPLKFTWEALTSAATALGRIRDFLAGKDISAGKILDDYISTFKEHIINDLDTPQAIATLWGLIKDNKVDKNDAARTIVEMDKVLGLRLLLHVASSENMEIPAEVLALVEERSRLKSEKDYAGSDAARDKITSLGFEVMDTPQGPALRSI